MDSFHLRMIIAGLFAMFILVLVLGDMKKRARAKPRAPKAVRERGFQRAKPPTAPTPPARSWKADARAVTRPSSARMSPKR